jgi:hypothetical protein
MGYDPYTPDTTTVHATIELPDDAELELSGVAAFNTALEQLADNAARGGVEVEDWSYSNFTTGPFVNTTWTGTTFDDGSTVDGTAPLAEATCKAGDLVLAIFNGNFAASAQAGSAHRIKLHAFEDGVDAGDYCTTPLTDALTPVSMHAVHEVTADSVVGIQVYGQVGTASESLSLFYSGQITLIVLRARS